VVYTVYIYKYIYTHTYIYIYIYILIYQRISSRSDPLCIGLCEADIAMSL
jgi:hypothetical protein